MRILFVLATCLAVAGPAMATDFIGDKVTGNPFAEQMGVDRFCTGKIYAGCMAVEKGIASKDQVKGATWAAPAPLPEVKSGIPSPSELKAMQDSVYSHRQMSQDADA